VYVVLHRLMLCMCCFACGSCRALRVFLHHDKKR
jgi:hypothetical protein